MRVLTIADGPVRAIAFSPGGDAIAASITYDAIGVFEVAGARPVGQVRIAPRDGYRPHRAFAVEGIRGRLSWARLGDWHNPHASSGDLPGMVEGEVICERVLCRGGRLVVATSVHGAQPQPWRFHGYRFRSWLPVPGAGWALDWTVGPTDDTSAHCLYGTDADRFFTVEVAQPHCTTSDWVCRASADGGVVDPTTFRESWFPREDRPPLIAAAPDGGQVVLGRPRSVVVWTPRPPGLWRPGGRPQSIPAGSGRLTGLAFHPSGAYLAATNTDGTVRLFDAESWQVVRRYDWGLGRLECVAFSPDGSLGAAGTADGRVVLWDADG